MKKALLAALCFTLVSLALVNGTFAMPDINQVFADLTALFGAEKGLPELGGEGTAVHVEIVSDQTPRNLYPGGEASRTFRVENLGSGGVFFRLVYAVQYDAESWEHLTIRFAHDGSYREHPWQDIRIGGVDYRMKVLTYTSELAEGVLSSPVTLSIAMGAAVTGEQLGRYRSDFLQTRVLAIDPAPFKEKGYTEAVDALDLALPLDKLNPF